MYCAYLRKSRADRDAELRGEGETLARHKALLIALSEKYNKPIEKWYQEVVSGDTIATRPVMQELLRDVEDGMWEGVYVVEVERLARGNTRDQGVVADTFKYSGTEIITLTKTYDPENEFDEEYFEFGLFMSRREYKTINRRLQRGRISSVREGKFVSSTAPYGYERVKIPHEKGYTLKIIPEEAEIVRMIFNWYCIGEPQKDGTSIRLGPDAIASRLDAMGVRPRMAGKWSKATISDMLRNSTYAGMVHFGYDKDVKTVKDNRVVSIRKRNPDCEVAKGRHEPIISMELYQMAGQMKQENQKNTVTSGTELQNPLSGIIYCAKCGAAMTRLGPNSRNRYATIKCSNKYCDTVSAPLFLVEEKVLQFLREWIKEYRLSLPREAASPIDDGIASGRQQFALIRREQETIQKQMNRAYTLLEQEVYTIDTFRQRINALQDDMSRLQKSEDAVQAELAGLEKLKHNQDKFIPTVERLLDSYATNTVRANNQILKEVISRIDYRKSERNTRGGLHNANFSLHIYPKIPS